MIFATANQAREAFGEELWAAINRHIDLDSIDWEPVELYDDTDLPWYRSSRYQDAAKPLPAMLPLFGALFHRIITLRDLVDVDGEISDMAVVVEGAAKRAIESPNEATLSNLILLALLLQTLERICTEAQQPSFELDNLFEISLATTQVTQICLLAAAQL